MIQKTLENKVALVTGGATGMGYAAAKLYLEHGAKVVIAGRRQDAGEKALQSLRQISPDIHFVQTDVSKSSDVHQLINQTVQLFGKLDIAFNNAGIEGTFSCITDTSEDEFDSLISINLKGVWLSCKYEIEQFQKQGTGGIIVNTSSWLAKGALVGSSLYSASKTALDGLTRALAIAHGHEGIRINNVNPGYIQTPMLDRFFPAEVAEEVKLAWIKHVPLNRVGTAEDVAQAVLWLSSPQSSYVTGETLLIDGGFAIGGQRL